MTSLPSYECIEQRYPGTEGMKTKMIRLLAVKLPLVTVAYPLLHQEHCVTKFRVNAQSTQDSDTGELNVKLPKNRIEINGNEVLAG